MRINPRLTNPTAIFIFFLVVYSLIVLLPRSKGMALTNGDEPHYLVMTYSLLHDRDLQLVNNYENADYRSWYPYPEGKLAAHMVNIQGKLYPLHQVGLALILLPGFALAGRLGAVMSLIFLTSLGLAALYQTLHYFVKKKIALITILLVGLSAPIGIYSSLIYPEVVIFFIICMTLKIILDPKFTLSKKNILMLLPLISIMPVFHIKFSLLMAILVIFINLKVFKKTSKITLLLFDILSIIPLLIYLAWLNIYVDGNLLLALRTFSGNTTLTLINVHSGLLAILVDRENGIFIFSPYFIYIVYICFQVLTNFRTKSKIQLQNNIFLLLFSVPFITMFTTYVDVIGGQNPSGRYLLPVIPALVILLSQALSQKMTKRIQVKIISIMALYSLIIFIILSLNPILALPSGHESNLFNFLFRGKAYIIHALLPNLSKYQHIIKLDDYIKGWAIMFILLILSNIEYFEKRLSRITK